MLKSYRIDSLGRENLVKELLYVLTILVTTNTTISRDSSFVVTVENRSIVLPYPKGMGGEPHEIRSIKREYAKKEECERVGKFYVDEIESSKKVNHHRLFWGYGLSHENPAFSVSYTCTKSKRAGQ